MPVRALRLVLLALVAALAGTAASLFPSDSPAPTPPAFLASALGPDVASTPERLTDDGHSVSLPRSGYKLEAGVNTFALSSDDQDGDSWHQFESGAARSTPFGSEAVVLDGNVVEQFLTVEKRTGPKRWRWKLDTGTLKPHLRPDGSVLISPGNIVAGFRIRPAAILDSRGRDISPKGTRWDLEREDGDWFLALDVDDAKLPLPYVIDPATLGLTDVASAANASATTLVIPKPGALAVNDQMVAQVTARNNTVICAPAGWTSVDRRVNGATLTQELFRKTAVAGDVAAANFTFTLDNSAGCVSPLATRASGGIIAVYGVDNSAPIVAAAGQANASSTNITAPGITVGIGDGLVGFYGTANGTTITQPGGVPTFFELWDIASGTFTTSQLSGTIVAAAGPTGNKTATAAAAALNIGQLVGLRVDATVPTAPVVTVTETDADTHVVGTTLFYRPGGNGGTFGVAATATDAQSGLQRISFPGLVGGFTPITVLNDTTSPYSQTYTWTAGATDSGAKTVTSEDNATNTNTSTFTLTSDSAAPPTTVTTNEGANAGLQHFVNTGANAYTLYYRPTATGDLTFSAVATDAAAGTLNVAFPTLATTGFTGTTLTDAGAPYLSNTYTFTNANVAAPPNATIVSTDNVGNATTDTVTFNRDTTAPTGGALTVNSVAASGGGTQSYDTDGAFTIGTRTDYTDAASGIATSTLTREQGTLAADVCSAYGAPTTIVGTPAQSGLANGCYRYVLTGTDNVGNTSTVTTVVKVDTGNPTTTATAPTEGTNPGNQFYAVGSDTHYVRAGASGSFTLNATASDVATLVAGVTFPDLSGVSGWTGTGNTDNGTPFASTTYSWSAAAAPGSVSVVATDTVGRTGNDTITIADDSGLPTGGALTVNTVAATGGGSQSYDSDGAFTIGARTDYTDAASGIATSTLTRENGTLNADACSAYGAPTTLVGTPAQSGLATGCYRFVLTGTDNVGNTSTVTTVVKVDTSAPAAPGLVLSDSSADVHTTGTTAFYRPAGSGAFDVTASATDGQSGILDYSFPALAGFTGSGPGATRTYTLATPTEPNGAKPVTARNQALLSSTATNFTLTSDATGPTGGALTVNSVAASGGGTQSYDGDGAFTIGVRTDYNADAASGIATSVLTREQGTLNADACSAYGAPTTIVGAPAQSGLATGCYRFVLTGTDNVGNTTTVTTVVKVDTSGPAAPGLVLSDASAAVHTTGTTAFYRPSGSGSFDVTASSTDAQSGILDYSFPALAGFTGSGAGATRTYTLATPTEPNGAKPVTARNQALVSSTATNFTLTSDATGPTGGAVTVNGVAASGGGSQSYDSDGAFTIGARTDYNADAASGFATSTLTRENGTLNADACSAYGAPTTLVGTPAQSGLATGCYRFVLTGTDNVGNTSTVTTVVKVDTTAPAAPTLLLSDSSADVHTTGTTAFYRPAGTGSFDVAASSTDAQSGVLDYVFPDLAGFNESSVSSTVTYTLASPTEPNGAKTVTARNQALLTTGSNFTLTADSVAPTGGALTVNSVAASGGGTQSYDNDGAFTIGGRTDYTDATAGLASSTLTREQGTLAADACSAYGAPTTLVGTPAQSGLATGCYRYLLTGTDNVGNTVSITTVVKVDTSAPAAPGLVLSDSSADVHTSGTTAFYRPAGSGSFDVTASSTDAQSGILDYSFPVLAGFTGSGAGATRTYTLATPTEPNGAKPVTARNQALAQLQRDELHAHLGRCCPDGRRPHGQRRRRFRRRYSELRRRRRLHDRPPHRLHRRGLRPFSVDPHARAGPARL